MSITISLMWLAVAIILTRKINKLENEMGVLNGEYLEVKCETIKLQAKAQMIEATLNDFRSIRIDQL